MGEPPAWTQERMDRLKQQYFQFQYGGPTSVMQVDNYIANNPSNTPPSDFSTNVLKLGAFASKELK